MTAMLFPLKTEKAGKYTVTLMIRDAVLRFWIKSLGQRPFCFFEGSERNFMPEAFALI